MIRSSLRRSAAPALRPTLALALAVTTFACGGGASSSPQEGGMDREVFIATYVDLRVAVGRNGAHELTDAERTRILADHGATEQDLLEFVEIHGTDVAYMRDVWDEVETKLDEVRLMPATPDTL